MHRSTVRNEVSVTKSASDKREYRALILENKLKVLLISDKITDKAAGSLTVGAGSLNNPQQLPGLAHFCEHMVFLGTEKYPEESGFDKFLSDNGGGSNAYTDEDHTNYHFDVAPEALPEALDRFAGFFTSPLFTESATEREIQAVNSEHEENTPDDDWRSTAIQKCTSDPNHPYQMFATGTLETLWTRPREKNIDVRSALMTYHSSFYSANMMSVAVLGKETLDELEKLVEPLFGCVQNKDVEMPIWSQTPFGGNETGIWISVLPIKDIRQMNLVFSFPDTTPHYKSGSGHYITHLLGHEGKGSILSLFKKKGWVNELSAEVTTIARGFGCCSIELELTEEGLNKAEDIPKVIFQYLTMLREIGPQPWIWDELRDMEAMNFRFKDQQNAESYACQLTPKMLTYPLEDVLSAEYLMSEYKPEEISQYLTFLVPEKCRITVFAKENASRVNLVEEFYQIQYSVDKIRPELIEQWKNCGTESELSLPLRNEFIPSAFDLKLRNDTGIIPRLVASRDLSRAFFLQDNEFMLPKGVVRVEIFSPLPLESAKNQAMNALVKRTVEDSLSEFSYNASVAGLKYAVLDTVYGLEVYVSGYDHKLGVLLEKVIGCIVNYGCEESRFDVLKEAYLRYLKNWEREQPRKHAHWNIGYILRDKRWTQKELLESLQDVNKDDLLKYVKNFVSDVKLEWLVYGNFTKDEAVELVTKCENIFVRAGSKSLPKEQETRLREIMMKPGADCIYQSEHYSHSDSCATVLFQTGVEESRGNVLVELMDQLAYESCYTQLRTKEQLGYVVYTTVRKSNGTRGFQILVQSAYDAAYVESRIDSYIAELYETLKGMTEENFIQHRNALAVRKAEKPKEIATRAEHLWFEISTKQHKFNRVAEELKELETLTLKDALEYFQDIIGPPSAKRRRLNVQVISKVEKKKDNKQKKEETDSATIKTVERNPCKIVDLADWKAKHEFYPPAQFPESVNPELVLQII